MSENTGFHVVAEVSKKEILALFTELLTDEDINALRRLKYAYKRASADESKKAEAKTLSILMNSWYGLYNDINQVLKDQEKINS